LYGEQEAKDELCTTSSTISQAAPAAPPPTALRGMKYPDGDLIDGCREEGGSVEEELRRVLATMNLEALQEEVRDQFDGKLRRVAHDMQGMVREEIGSVWRVSSPYRRHCCMSIVST
jgi:hypothetical protein